MQSCHDSIFIITLQAVPKKMMNGRVVKSMKLFIYTQLCLGPRLGIVLILAFFKDLMFLQVTFYPLPDHGTIFILLSSLFIISEKFENKKGNEFLMSTNDWHRTRKKETTFFQVHRPARGFWNQTCLRIAFQWWALLWDYPFSIHPSRIFFFPQKISCEVQMAASILSLVDEAVQFLIQHFSRKKQ